MKPLPHISQHPNILHEHDQLWLMARGNWKWRYITTLLSTFMKLHVSTDSWKEQLGWRIWKHWVYIVLYNKIIHDEMIVYLPQHHPNICSQLLYPSMFPLYLCLPLSPCPSPSSLYYCTPAIAQFSATLRCGDRQKYIFPPQCDYHCTSSVYSGI